MGRTTLKTYRVGYLLINQEFWESHKKPLPNGCIEWTGARHRQGYGMMGGYDSAKGKGVMTVTHRIAMMEHLGRALTHDDFVISQCDNKLCCNPAHYKIGFYRDKAKLMKERGRHYRTGPRGSYNLPPKKQAKRSYKYSEKEIQWIRNATVEAIAKKYKLTKVRANSMQTSFRNGYRWLPWTKA